MPFGREQAWAKQTLVLIWPKQFTGQSTSWKNILIRKHTSPGSSDKYATARFLRFLMVYQEAGTRIARSI